jgi:hypothetical protein
MANTAQSHQKMETQLRQLGAKLDLWKAKGEQAAKNAKTEYKKRLAQYQKAKIKVAALKSSSSGAFKDIKSGAEKALRDLSTSIKKAKSEFN